MSKAPPKRSPTTWLAIAGPGLLVAATGVGAGDLATASLTGTELGVGILWAVWIGALFKFVVTEGLARYQLATGETLLAGCSRCFGRPFQAAFALYLLPWSFFVGGALISACGVASHAMFPLFDSATTDKQVYGVVHSLAGMLLVTIGGYRLFEWAMRLMIGLMFATVLLCAALLANDWPAILQGAFVPRIPEWSGEGLSWTIALMGGIGGTLTVLCYGYWIREEGREGPEALRVCRIDLGVGYFATALFGAAMVVIGSTVQLEGSGASLLAQIAERLDADVGSAAGWAFRLGAWGAVFSSLLGVQQCVPMLFADFVADVRMDSPEARRARVSASSLTYRGYLIALSLIPCLALFATFKEVQKAYAILGAGFMPLLALALLYLNSRRGGVDAMRNRPLTIALLCCGVIFFVIAAIIEVRQEWQ